MNNITFKKTQKTVVVPRTQQEEYVYMEISEVNYYFTAFQGKVVYYYNETVETGVDENNDPIFETRRIDITPPEYPTFTVQEANYLQAQLPPTTGASLSDILNALIVNATMYQLSTNPKFGADHTGWELVQ